MKALVPEGYSAGGVMGAGIWDKGALEMVKSYEDPLNPHREEGKAELVVWYENLRAFQDTLEVCRFSLYNSNVDTQNKSIPALTAKYFNAVTGRKLTGDDGLLAGERIVNLERLFNQREGLTKEDDRLPDRLLREPLPDGPAKGQVVDLEPMVDRYYQLRGWHMDTGIPKAEKLKSLGL
jgi:aldehyde:ferredoxin oxidoreductase